MVVSEAFHRIIKRNLMCRARGAHELSGLQRAEGKYVRVPSCIYCGIRRRHRAAERFNCDGGLGLSGCFMCAGGGR